MKINASRPSSNQKFELIVIGSGSAGEGVSDEAHHSGHSIAIIEKDKVGGDSRLSHLCRRVQSRRV